jgi:hypothetical protein
MQKLAAMRTGHRKLLLTGARFYRLPARIKTLPADAITMRVTLRDGDESDWPQELDFEALPDYVEPMADVQMENDQGERGVVGAGREGEAATEGGEDPEEGGDRGDR